MKPAMEDTLKAIGHSRSLDRSAPQTKDGEPLPWYTYSAIHFLKERLPKEATVFEYGSGNSTLWWAQRAKNIVAVEHSLMWYQRIKRAIDDNALSNAAVRLVDNGEHYPGYVWTYRRPFRVIAIDGVQREACIKEAASYMQQYGRNGVILLDNSNRSICREVAHKYLIDDGWKELPFFGFGPVCTWQWKTSIFYRIENILGI